MKVKEPNRRSGLRQARLAILSGCALLALAACSSTEDPAEIGRPCPAIGVLGDTDHLTLFAGQGHDLTDIALTANLEGAVSNCTYDTDERTIYVNVAFGGTAELGPAAPSREFKVPAFIAVTDNGSKVVHKQTLDLTLLFGGTLRNTQFSQTIEDIQIRYPEGADGARYEVLVGFQLTSDQLAYNRRTGAR